MRSGPGRRKRGGVRNPAGTKVARLFGKQAGMIIDGREARGCVYHTGALTKLNQERALKRIERK
jgi:hypothetical protein